jgi:hypothetical protein
MTQVSLDKKTTIPRRGCSESTLLLRPAVQMELAGEMVAGDIRAHMLESAQASQLLLIVEQPFKVQGLLDLTRDLDPGTSSDALFTIAQQITHSVSLAHIQATPNTKVHGRMASASSK